MEVKNTGFMTSFTSVEEKKVNLDVELFDFQLLPKAWNGQISISFNEVP